MVPKRSPWVQMSSAQPRTSRSVSAGRASVVRSRSWGSAVPAGPGKRASRTEPPDQIERSARPRQSAAPPPRWRRHRGGTAQAPTWTAPAHGSAPSTLCLCRRAAPGPPSARSQWLSQPWSARWEPAPPAAAEQARAGGRAPRPDLPDPVGDGRPALVQPRRRRVPQPRARPAACRSTSPSTGAHRRLRPAAGDLGHARRHPAAARDRHPRHRGCRRPRGGHLRDGGAQRRAPASPPPGTASARPERSSTFDAGLPTRSTTTVQGVYPVSVALVRQGSSTPVARFTTFLTYQQPNAVSATGGPLRVGVVVPVTASGLTTMADALTDHHDVADHARREPAGRQRSRRHPRPRRQRALGQLAALERRRDDRPALRAHQPRRAHRGRALRRNRRAAQPRRRHPARAPASSPTAAPGWTRARRSPRATPPTWPRACSWPAPPRRWSATTTWPRPG